MKIPTRWKWTLAIAIPVVLFFSSEGSRTYWQRKKILNEMQDKLQSMKDGNRDLATQLERLKYDPRAIEQIARKELGMVQPGEMEYRFVVHHTSASGKGALKH